MVINNPNDYKVHGHVDASLSVTTTEIETLYFLIQIEDASR